MSKYHPSLLRLIVAVHNPIIFQGIQRNIFRDSNFYLYPNTSGFWNTIEFIAQRRKADGYCPSSHTLTNIWRRMGAFQNLNIYFHTKPQSEPRASQFCRGTWIATMSTGFLCLRPAASLSPSSTAIARHRCASTRRPPLHTKPAGSQRQVSGWTGAVPVAGAAVTGGSESGPGQSDMPHRHRLATENTEEDG